MAMKHGFKHRFKIPASSATETEVLELNICRQALPRAIWYSNGFWHMQLVVTDAQMTDRKLSGLLQKGKSAGPCSTWQINFLWRLTCILRCCRSKTWLGQQQIREGFHFTKSNCQVIFIMSNVVPAWIFPNQRCRLLSIVSKIQPLLSFWGLMLMACIRSPQTQGKGQWEVTNVWTSELESWLKSPDPPSIIWGSQPWFYIKITREFFFLFFSSSMINLQCHILYTFEAYRKVMQINIHIYSFQILFPYRYYGTDCCSLLCTVGPFCLLYILYSVC